MKDFFGDLLDGIRYGKMREKVVSAVILAVIAAVVGFTVWASGSYIVEEFRGPAAPAPITTAPTTTAPVVPATEEADTLVTPAPGVQLYGWGDETDEEFDWGETPKLPSISLQPGIVLPSTPPPSGGGISRVPVIGDLWSGIGSIVSGVRWFFRNIWLILIVAVLLSLMFRIPFWAPFIILWELFQTLWRRDKTARDVWKQHKEEFRRKEPEKPEEPKSKPQQQKGGKRK